MRERISDRLADLITVGIILSTMAIAVVGWLHVVASDRSNDQGQRGKRVAIAAGVEIQRAAQGAQVDYENFLRSQEQRGQAGSALQQSLFTSGQLRDALVLKQQRLTALADATQALTPLTADGPYGPERDGTFPNHFFNSRSLSTERMLALEDAANEENTAWEVRAAMYTAILTLLAVALYLFGFALALPVRLTRAFGVVGALLLFVGTAWAAKIALTPPRHVPDEAATEYAVAVVAGKTASDAAGYRVALSHLDRAIELWPTFGRAYLDRALATLTAASPKLIDVLLPEDALRSATRDLERARQLGLNSVPVLETLAATNFSLALHGDTGRFETSADLSHDLIDLIPDDPVARFNLALGLLGAGRVHESRAAFTDALSRVLYFGGDPSKPRLAGPFQEVYVASALTDLEALAARNPQLSPFASQMKGFVVGSVAGGQLLVPAAGVSAAAPQAQVTPTTLNWFTDGIAGFDKTRDRLSAQWYWRANNGPWVGMPEVSGPLDPTRETYIPRYSSRNLLGASIPARCLSPGAYRVELYVNGGLAGTAETDARFGSLEGFVDRSLNLEACHPADWRPSKGNLPGFRDALASPDGSQGVLLMRYDLASVPATISGKDPASAVSSLIDISLRSSADLLPGTLTAVSPPLHQFFAGLQGPTEVGYSYQGGSVYVQAGIDPKDGAALVTLAYGPTALFGPSAPPGQSLQAVLSSIGEYRYGGGSF